MYMKKLLVMAGAIILIEGSMSGGCNFDIVHPKPAPEPFFTHNNYSQDDLIAVRLAWLMHPDNEIIYVRRAAAQCAQELYLVDDIAQGVLINTGDETVTTVIGPSTTAENYDRPITLSYDDFNKLLCDTVITALAQKVLARRGKIVGSTGTVSLK